MDLSIKIVTLLGLALAIPGASALTGAASPLLPQVFPAPVAAAPTVAHATNQVAESMAQLGCRQAVQVTFAWYGARITDHRDGQGNFLAPFTWIETVTRHIPIVKVSTETVWSPGLLGGVLAPITKSVTTVTGYQTITTPTTESVQLGVGASWKESYLVWGTYRDTVDLSLPVGLGFLVGGRGHQVPVCDANRPILQAIPDPSATGVDVWCAGCSRQPANGWALDVLNLSVHLATGGDFGLPPMDGPLLVASGELSSRVAQAASGLHLTAADAARQAAERGAPNPDTSAPPSASVIHVPVSTGFAGVGLVGLGPLAALVVAARRR
ncbi:MAG: hypothetical protein ACYDBQ_09570 [Thermoplasmatota archaeon]